MKYFFLCFMIFTAFYLCAQENAIKGSINSTDSTVLKVISLSPDNFPNVSVIFEAIKNNEPIFGLSKDKIRVYEDESPCPVISLSEISDNYPINISLVIDHSGSMAEDYMQLIDSTTGQFVKGVEFDSLGFLTKYPYGYVSPIDNAKKAVKNFLSGFPSSKDSIQVIGFSTRVDIVSDFSTDKAYLKSITDSIKSDSSTAFLDALEYAVNQLKDRSGIKIVVALTDGLDNSSHISKEKLIEISNRYNIPIFNVGLGYINKAFLKEISDDTKGSFFYTDNSNTLNEIYKTIQKRIKSIYDLKYESINLNSNDTLREIRIEFEIDSLYLTDNIASLKVPVETIKYISNKRKKETLKLIGLTITSTIIASGILLFVFRRRKRKKKEKA